MWIVEYSARVGTAVADPDIRSGLLFEKAGEIFRRHARQQVALDIAVADDRGRRRSRDLGFSRSVNQRWVAPLVAKLHPCAVSPAGSIGDAPDRRLDLVMH